MEHPNSATRRLLRAQLALAEMCGAIRATQPENDRTKKPLWPLIAQMVIKDLEELDVETVAGVWECVARQFRSGMASREGIRHPVGYLDRVHRSCREERTANR